MTAVACYLVLSLVSVSCKLLLSARNIPLASQAQWLLFSFTINVWSIPIILKLSQEFPITKQYWAIQFFSIQLLRETQLYEDHLIRYRIISLMADHTLINVNIKRVTD